MRNFLIRLFIHALALSAAAYLVEGVRVTDDFGPLLVVALVFGVVNAILGPVLKIFTLPFIFLSFGLFLVVVNAILLVVTEQLVAGLSVDSFPDAILGALVVSIVGTVLNWILGDGKQKDS